MGVLDPHSEGGIPEIVEEHVDTERGRPVGHGHAHAIRRHRATDEQEWESKDRRYQGHPVRTSPVGWTRGGTGDWFSFGYLHLRLGTCRFVELPAGFRRTESTRGQERRSPGVKDRRGQRPRIARGNRLRP